MRRLCRNTHLGVHKTHHDLLRETRHQSRHESRTGIPCRRTPNTAVEGYNCAARSPVITALKYPLGYYSVARSDYRMEISHVPIRHLQSLSKNHVDGLRSTRGTGNARCATQPTMRRACKRKINWLILVPAFRALTAHSQPAIPLKPGTSAASCHKVVVERCAE